MLTNVEKAALQGERATIDHQKTKDWFCRQRGVHCLGLLYRNPNSTVGCQPASGSKADDSNDVEVFTSPEGESYVELGQKKRVTVREFKGKHELHAYSNMLLTANAGKILVDIREFYGKDREDEKPGKKGISLNPDQVGLSILCPRCPP